MKEDSKRGLCEYWWLLIVAVAAGLRFFGIGSKALWVDEGYSAKVIELGWKPLVRGVFELENHPPLYFAALKAWSFVWSPGSDGYVRGLSALASVLIVLGVYKVGRLVFGKWEGIVGAGLTAVSAYQIYFAQEARLYALVGALGVWSTYFLMRGLKDEGRLRDWVAYCALSIAALWTFYYSVFLVAAQGVTALMMLMRREGKGVRVRWVASQMVIVLAFVPLVFVMLGRGGGMRAAGEGMGMEGAVLSRAVVEYAAWVPGPLPDKSLAVGLTLLGVFPVWAAIMGIRKKAVGVAGMVILFALPFGLVALLPYKPFGFEGKHLFFVTPFYWALAGYAAVRFRVAGIASCAALVASNIFALATYYPDSYQKEDWDWAAEYVGERFGSRDAIFCEPAWEIYSFERYWTRKYAGEVVRGSAPAMIDSTGGRIAEDELREMVGGYRRVWLVEVENKAVGPNPNVEKWLGEMMGVKMRIERRFAVGTISIVLFQRKEGERDEDSQRARSGGGGGGRQG